MVYLIGNRGMLGSDVGDGLAERGIEFIASDIEVDITKPDELKEFVEKRDIDWIINCSAYTAVDRAEEEPDAAFRINSEGVRNIAVLAAEKKAGIIHISTDYVFNGDKDGAYLETDTPDPATVYGRSKLKGEEYLKDIVQEYFIIRIAWLFGKHGGNFVYTMLRLFDERDKVKVVSDQIGSPTYTRDLADLIIKIISENRKDYGIYHYTCEGMTNWYEFSQEIYEIAKKYNLVNRKVSIVPVSSDEFITKAKRPMNSYLSKEKVKSTFDIQIPFWKESLNRFLHDLSIKRGAI